MFPDWWKTIDEGESRVFGMLQLDIAGHSQLEGSSYNFQQTKANLKKYVSSILSIYDAALLNWAGDGGAYLFLMKNPQVNDDMVTGALQILHDMLFFNESNMNRLTQPLNIRVSCHQGACTFSKDPSTLHGRALNYFLKYEREIGLENTVVITESVHRELNSEKLREKFEEKGEHVWKLGNKEYTDSLYASASLNYERIFDENRTLRNKVETLESEIEILQTKQQVPYDGLEVVKGVCSSHLCEGGYEVVRKERDELKQLKHELERQLETERQKKDEILESLSYEQDRRDELERELIEEIRKKRSQINPLFGEVSTDVNNRLVFVLMPFTDSLTEIYESIVQPTVERLELDCYRADDFWTNTAIIQDIWKRICEARIVIADLSGLNANVMYELGIAHTIGKKTILIYQREEEAKKKFPLDITHIRRIEYEDSAVGGSKLENNLSKMVKVILEEDGQSSGETNSGGFN